MALRQIGSRLGIRFTARRFLAERTVNARERPRRFRALATVFRIDADGKNYAVHKRYTLRHDVKWRIRFWNDLQP